MRDSSTRSFSTVNARGIGDRNRRNRQRIVIISLIAVVAILITVFTVLIFGKVFGWFGNEEKPPVENGDITIEYEDIVKSSADVHKGDLILINSSFPYTFGENISLLNMYTNRGTYGLAGSAGYMMEETALIALNKMTNDFSAQTGESYLYIRLNDCYRDRDKQNELNAEAPNNYGPAGQSEHHTGKCVDFKVYKNGSFYDLDSAGLPDAEKYNWIYNNAHKYGFVHRYPAEKASVTGVANELYHFRYVGVAHATYMQKNSLCLEEYLDLIRDSHAYKSEHLKFTAEDGTSYEVYYVAASTDDVTEIPVPKADADGKISYTISGDNKEGFIVTVEIKK